MSMHAADHSKQSEPFEPAPVGVVSGIRPARRSTRALRVGTTLPDSLWAPFAAVTWLLALTPAAVIAVRAGFTLALIIAVMQALLVVGLLTRVAWGKAIHLLLLGIGLLFSAMFIAMIAFDRSEYRVDLEHFDSVIREPVGQGSD